MESLMPTSPTHSRELQWLNGFLETTYEHVDQLKDGIAYNQILDALYGIPLDQLNYHLYTSEFKTGLTPNTSNETDSFSLKKEPTCEPTTNSVYNENNSEHSDENDSVDVLSEKDDTSNVSKENDQTNGSKNTRKIPKLTIEIVNTPKDDTDFESRLTPHQRVRMAALENFQLLFKEIKHHRMQIPNLKSLMRYQPLIRGNIDIHNHLLKALYTFKKRYYPDVIYEDPIKKLKVAKEQSFRNETLQRKQEKGLGSQSIASPREIYGKAFDMIDVTHSGKITKTHITTYFIKHPTAPITPLPMTPGTPVEEEEKAKHLTASKNHENIESKFDQATHLLQMKARLSHFVRHRTEILQKATPGSVKIEEEDNEEDDDFADPENLEQWQEVKFILKYIEKALKENDPLTRPQFVSFMITQSDKFKIRSLTTPRSSPSVSPLPSELSNSPDDASKKEYAPYAILDEADNHPMILTNADERFLRIYQMRKKVAAKKREERKKKHLAYLHNLAKIKKKKKVFYDPYPAESDPHFGLPPIKRKLPKKKPHKKRVTKKHRRYSTTGPVRKTSQSNFNQSSQHGRRSLPLIQRELVEHTKVIEKHSDEIYHPTPSLHQALSPLTMNKAPIDLSNSQQGAVSHRSDIRPTILLQDDSQSEDFVGVESDSEPIYSSDSENLNYGAPPRRVRRSKKSLAPIQSHISKKAKIARDQRRRHKKRKDQVVSSYKRQQPLDSARSSDAGGYTTLIKKRNIKKYSSKKDKKENKKKKKKAKKLKTSSPLIPSSSPLPRKGRSTLSPNVRPPQGTFPDMKDIYRRVSLIPPEEMKKQRQGYVQDLLFSYFHSDTSMQMKSRQEKKANSISPFSIQPEESTTLHKAFPKKKRTKPTNATNPFEEFEMYESVDLDAVMSPSNIPPIPTYSPKA